MAIYIIRHAPTFANVSGKMVKNYNSQEILPFDRSQLSIKLPNVDAVYISDTIRAKQTASILYPNAKIKILKCLNEFDCSGIGGLNFWEMTENEFNNKIHLTGADIYSEIDNMIKSLYKLETENGINIICISHGLKTRALIHFLSKVKSGVNESDFNPYRLINSMDEQFRNLDVLKITEDFNFEIFRAL